MIIKIILLFLIWSIAQAQQTGTCVAGTEFCENNKNTTVNTNTSTNNNNNTDISTSTTTNTNNNTNTDTSTSTSNNTNTNTNTNTNNNNTTSNSNSTSTSTNINNSSSDVNSKVDTKSVNTNNNVNVNESTSTSESKVNTENVNVNENKSVSESVSDSTQKIKNIAPPPTATSPSIGASYSQDLCSTGISGALQTQILGISSGMSVTDFNCERIKLAKVLYDAGMRVASVSMLCQDSRVFQAMYMAGTPCPYRGMIGEKAAEAWTSNPKDRPDYNEWKQSEINKCIVPKKSKRECIKEWESTH
jgi:hypothetical protein